MLKPRETIKALINLPGKTIEFDCYCTEEEPWRGPKNGYFTHEPDIVSSLINFIKSGDLCIDAGACIGYHSILMAKLVGENGRVLAFEPDPKCFAMLKDNLALNSVDNVCSIPVALWESNVKAVDFYQVNKRDCATDSEVGYSSFCKYQNADLTKISVETVTLDDVITPEMPAVKFLKIDCEGAEEGILHGAEKLLRRGVDAVVCEFNFNVACNEKAIRKYMASLGYDFFYLFENGHLPECIPTDVTIEPSKEHWHFNGLFSKQSFVLNNWRYCCSAKP